MKHLILILSIVSMSSSLFAQLDRSKTPEAQPNPSIKIEIPEAMTFGNGLKVIMVENHKLPKVSFQLYVDYPYEMEGNKVGLSGIFGEMLEAGTENTPKDKFDEQIDYIGASFFPNSRGFYASSLKKHTTKLLSLLNEVMTQPAFSQEDFDRIISQNMSNLAALPSDASNMSANVSNVVNYGKNHPYGEVITEETLGNITLEDVKAFYKKNFVPNYAYLVIVGDIYQEDVKTYVRDYFEGWEKGPQLTEQDFVAPKAKGNNVYFVNKPGAVQSVIKITHNVKLTPGHEDEIKLSVLNQILGGGSFSARLMSNLREDKAYTYGCYSSIFSDPLIGIFSAGGSFRNEVTDSAIVEILKEIELIGANEVTDQELDLVKKSMTGSFARSLENPQTIARFALNTVRYNLPSTYYSNYLKRLENITKQDLLMVADKYLSPKNLNIVVVGNEDIAEKLNVFDTDGKIDFKNYYGEDQEQLKKTAEGITAASILNQYVMHVMMAKSETELTQKIAATQQIEIVSKAVISEMNATILSYSVYGATNKTASIAMLKSPMGTATVQKEWFNGEAGGSFSQGGAAESYQGDKLAQKKKLNYPVEQVNYIADAAIQVTLLGIITLEDGDFYKLKIEKEEGFGFEYYSVETGLLMIEEKYETSENGEQTSVTITHSDYMTQSGVFIPKKTSINTQGQIIKLEVVTIKTNKKVKSKAFSGDFKKIEKLLSKLK